MVGQAIEAFSQPTHLFQAIGRLVTMHISTLWVIRWSQIAVFRGTWFMRAPNLVLVQPGTPDDRT